MYGLTIRCFHRKLICMNGRRVAIGSTLQFSTNPTMNYPTEFVLRSHNMYMKVIIITIRSTHGRGADLPFFCVSATVQYW